MKKLFEAIDRHSAIFIWATVLLVMLGINYLAYLKLEQIERQAQAGRVQDQERVLKKVFGADLAADYRAVSLEQSVSPKYYPFVEYIETARFGRFVNVSNQGTRCHYPNRDLCTAKGGMKEIWIFGGSTTFGYGVKDNETIAAYLAERLPDYRIVNFGAASYYSTIERIRFENLLAEFTPPKAAVFIDGLNDFYYFNVPDKSHYSPILIAAEDIIVNKPEPLRAIKNDLKALLGRLAIYRLLQVVRADLALNTKTTGTDLASLDQISKATASQEQITKAIARLHLNHTIVESIGDKLGISVLTVLQPVPTYGVGHKTSQVPSESLNFGDHANSGFAYREMLTPNGELRRQDSHKLNLANLGISEGMYVDTVHYTPLFSKKIALEIYKRLRPCLDAKNIQSKRTRCGSK